MQELSYNAGMIDRAAIFAELTRRNAIRRQAQLPLLDMRNEFHRAVEFSRWKTVCEEHSDQMRSEVIAELSKAFGGEPQSRWWTLGGQRPNAQATSCPPSIVHLISLAVAGEGFSSPAYIRSSRAPWSYWPVHAEPTALGQLSHAGQAERLQ